MNNTKIQATLITVFILVCLGAFLFQDLWKPLLVKQPETVPAAKFKKGSDIGKVIDTYKGVHIYYNGKATNVSGRNTTKDGYNLGLKYQCVEFVKRFYYEYLGHKMPDSYGHAKDFFDPSLTDGSFNEHRGLYQFRNGSEVPPGSNDVIVFGPTPYNRFGHIAIVSKVGSGQIEIVQQNPGVGVNSRVFYPIYQSKGKWYVDDPYILGWLRK